ncbi:uncharacterized protein LOC129587290 isoform X2 [Paramacrobiotus metropolitanus]|uniref:uncharacterized protein LOC129587290 isoform X2 n=1 Tax=Paramacrobiotus metropolitanus TaxID=2943436 RepID=UPI002446259A|nr:uncharacterized protein LOC129587290 isoform X2 [Paramacrobiotus metropolitanus]
MECTYAETENEACIRHLEHTILIEIFANLDLQSQMRIKRVCFLWNAILSDASTHNGHITINLEGCASTHCCYDDSYKLAALLQGAVHAGTKSLTITGLESRRPSYFLGPWLDAASIRLPVMVMQDASFPFSHWTYDECSLLRHGIIRRIRPFKDHCQALIINNCTFSGLFCRALFDLLYARDNSLVQLPESEKRWMISRGSLLGGAQGNLLSIDSAQITLRRVILPFVHGWEHAMSRFMYVINAHFPAVGADVYRKVQAIHARWVATLSYPDEWLRIRHLLSIFSGFQADGTPLAWGEVDLRELAVGQLSTMALLALSEAFLL